MKKIITLVLSLLLFSALIVPAYAIDTGPQRAPMYAHRYKYIPNVTSRVNTYKNIGTVSLDNTQSSTKSYLGYTVKSSGTVKMTIGISGSVQAQADALFAKIKSSVSAEVTTSRSYTKGKSYSTNFYKKKKKHGSITGYIPAIKTSGKMEDVLYDANSSDSYVISTKYITVNNSYVPLKNDMHFVNKTW